VDWRVVLSPKVGHFRLIVSFRNLSGKPCAGLILIIIISFCPVQQKILVCYFLSPLSYLSCFDYDFGVHSLLDLGLFVVVA